MDKQYYWEQAEQVVRVANQLKSGYTEENSKRLQALVRLAEVNLKMMEVAPDSE